MRAEAADDERDTVERLYNHILAAMGLVAPRGRDIRDAYACDERGDWRP